jgi:hypothetical protein
MRKVYLLLMLGIGLVSAATSAAFDPTWNESRSVQGKAEAEKLVTVPEGMVFNNGSLVAPPTQGVRFPPGIYHLEAEDADYWYLRSPAPLEFRSFQDGNWGPTRNVAGGIMVAKSYNLIPAGAFVEVSGTEKLAVWKLGQEFLRLKGKSWMLKDGPEEREYFIRCPKVGDLPDGLGEIWTSPKTRQAQGEYRHGLPNGKWTIWDSRGAKTITFSYVDGVQAGHVEMWYGSFGNPDFTGHLKLKGELVDGHWDGTVEWFYGGGRVRSERTYHSGVLAETVAYDSNGSKLDEARAQSIGREDDLADVQYLTALDKLIRNSALYAKRLP